MTVQALKNAVKRMFYVQICLRESVCSAALEQNRTEQNRLEIYCQVQNKLKSVHWNSWKTKCLEGKGANGASGYTQANITGKNASTESEERVGLNVLENLLLCFGHFLHLIAETIFFISVCSLLIHVVIRVNPLE